ncbi:MAG TPA: NAD(+) synthase [Bacillota bacterium]|nr:NAD(+) synthase [Clostridiales bacterium]HPT85064.1 NAD(+) synthase [Bacillota bacterium]
MKDGFVKLALASPPLRVADCEYNIGEIVRLALAASEGGAVVALFPELCVTGYSCSDLFFHSALLDAAERAVEVFAKKTAELATLYFLGVPVRLFGKLYNCCAAIFRGKLLALIPKTFLPNYNEFYEARQFTPAPHMTAEVSYAGQLCPFGTKILFEHAALRELIVGAEICEDLWCQTPPSTRHCMAGATLICNISASPESVGKPEYRRDLARMHSARHVCAYAYTSSGPDESTTDLIYSGHAFICEYGTTVAECPPFGGAEITFGEIDVKRLDYERRRLSDFVCERNPDYIYIPFETELSETMLTRRFAKRPFVPEDRGDRDKRCSLILDMQAAALAKRLRHTGAKTAVVGVSGGLDSTLALIVASRALDRLGRPRTDAIGVTMPCFGTGSRTKSNAEKLCRLLGVTFREIPIAKSVAQHLMDIGHDGITPDVTFENAQARERTQVLMDIANQTGGLVVGTGDLSEMALGWSTYNGDHMSMYAVNCSVPKTLVRYLIAYFADTCDSPELSGVLLDILDTPISPELIPSKDGEISQRTEEILGEYELHDFFLYYIIRWGYDPAKTLRIAKLAFAGDYDEKHIENTLKLFIRRFFSQQFKRSCTPDGVKLGTVSLSPRGDWRMPSDASAAAWLSML